MQRQMMHDDVGDDDDATELERVMPRIQALVRAGKIKQARAELMAAGFDADAADQKIKVLQKSAEATANRGKFPAPTSIDVDEIEPVKSRGSDDADRKGPPAIGDRDKLKGARQGQPQETDDQSEGDAPDKEQTPDTVSPEMIKAGVGALRASKGMKLSDVARACYIAMASAGDGDMHEDGAPGQAGPTAAGQNPD